MLGGLSRHKPKLKPAQLKFCNLLDTSGSSKTVCFIDAGLASLWRLVCACNRNRCRGREGVTALAVLDEWVDPQGHRHVCCMLRGPHLDSCGACQCRGQDRTVPGVRIVGGTRIERMRRPIPLGAKVRKGIRHDFIESPRRRDSVSAREILVI